MCVCEDLFGWNWFQSVIAQLCLRAAGELEEQKEKNEEKIKKEIQGKHEGFGEATCEINNEKGYYDAYKVQPKI